MDTNTTPKKTIRKKTTKDNSSSFLLANNTTETVPSFEEKYNMLVEQLLALSSLPYSLSSYVYINSSKKLTVSELAISLISGERINIVDSEIEHVKKNMTNQNLTDGLISNSPFYSGKTLEEIATMMVESKLIEPTQQVEIVDPIATYLRPNLESVSAAGEFTNMVHKKWPSFKEENIDIFSYSLAQMGTYLQQKGYKPS